jgi:hypothetical protein
MWPAGAQRRSALDAPSGQRREPSATGLTERRAAWSVGGLEIGDGAEGLGELGAQVGVLDVGAVADERRQHAQRRLDPGPMHLRLKEVRYEPRQEEQNVGQILQHELWQAGPLHWSRSLQRPAAQSGRQSAPTASGGDEHLSTVIPSKLAIHKATKP